MNTKDTYWFIMFCFFRGTTYKEYPKEGLFGNFLGILFVVYAGLVVYMVTKPEYKRQPKPEDGVLLTGSPE